MDHHDRVAAVHREMEQFVFALAAGDLDDLVPTCAGWEVRDLAVHVGQFCGFWSHVLCEGTGRPKTPIPEHPVEDAALVEWVANAGADLRDRLESTAAATPVWTWYDADQTAGFVARRSAHELAVHRYDAQAARGICSPIAPELAADGIDEIFDVLVHARPAPPGSGTGRTLALRSSDLGWQWSVTLGAGLIEVTRSTEDAGPGEGSDLTVSGTTSDLELALYHRPTLSPVDVHGDYTVLDEWHRRFTF
jgi:uncharacterized protein (TIGR03083 family)